MLEFGKIKKRSTIQGLKNCALTHYAIPSLIIQALVIIMNTLIIMGNYGYLFVIDPFLGDLTSTVS